jgi:cysteine desulfurase
MTNLDHSATTVLDSRVAVAMHEGAVALIGNPSSQHALGRAAASAVERGRRQCADVLGGGPGEIIFTSGAAVADSVADRRDRLAAALEARLGGVTVCGAAAPRLPNTLNVRFAGADAEAVLGGLPQLACSTDSACASGTQHRSHVLVAMGLSVVEASECLRLSLSPATSDIEIEGAVDMLGEAVTHVRSFARADAM